MIKESRTKNAKRNLLFGTIGKVVSVVLPFISRTIIINYLGVEYTGLGSLFSSILTVLSLTELGIGTAVVFGMYKPIAEGDDDKINCYLSFLRKCYLVIGAIVVVFGLAIMPFLSFLINGSYPSDINIYVLYLVYLSNSAIGYLVLAYRSSVLSANQRVDIISKVLLVTAIVQELLQILVLIIFKSFLLYSLIVPFATICSNVVKYYISKKMFPKNKPCGSLNKEETTRIKKQIFGLMLQKIGGVVLSSVDAIIISAFLGLTVLGKYNNYHYVISVLLGFFAIIPASIIPSIGNSIQTKTVEENYSDFRLFHFIYMWLIAFCCSCMLSLYQPFILLWLGSDFLFDFLFVIFITIYFWSYKFCDIIYVYREATGLWTEWKWVSLIAALFNLTLNLISVHFIGLYGILLSTILSEVLVYLPFFSFPLFSKYFGSKKRFLIFLKDQLLYLIVTVAACSLTYLATYFVPNEGILFFILKTLICIVVPNIVITTCFFKTKRFSGLCSFIKKSVFKRRKKYD